MTTTQGMQKREGGHGWLPAVAAGTLALLLRVIYVLDLRHSPLFSDPIMDAQIHDGWARGTLDFLHHQVPYFRAPLYPWFLEAIYSLGGGYLAARLAGALLSAVTVALVADLGRRFGGVVAGLFAGALLALCWPSIYFSGELLIVTFVTALAVLCLWLLVVAQQDDRPGLALAAGAVLGVAAMARPTVLAFLPMLLWLPLRTWPRAEAPRLAALRRRLAAAMVVLALLPAGALTVRNAVVGHDAVFVASQGGVNFYIGNNPRSDGRTAVVPGTRASWLGGFEDTIRIAQEAEGRPLKASEVSRYWWGKGLSWIASDPAAAARLYLHKVRLLLGAGERSNNKNLHFWRQQSGLLRLPLYTSWGVIFPLGLVGLLVMRRRRDAAPVIGFVLLYSLGILLFFVNERFRYPVLVGWASLAGLPLVALARSWSQGRRRAFALTATALGLSLLLVQLDRAGFTENQTDKDAFSRVTLGNAWMRQGEPAKALQAYDEAQAIQQKWNLHGFDEVEGVLHRQKAAAYRELRRWEEAAAELAWLKRHEPDARTTELEEAEQLLARKHYREAATAFKTLRKKYPDWDASMRGAAWSFFFAESYLTAEPLFQELLRRDPDDADALIGLGACMIYDSKDLEKAEKIIQEGLEKAPDHARGHHQMAVILVKQRGANDPGDKRLRYHLERAIHLDPENRKVATFLRRAGWYELLPQELRPARIPEGKHPIPGSL